jgi:hypothetical protein
VSRLGLNSHNNCVPSVIPSIFIKRHGVIPWSKSIYVKYRRIDGETALCEICGKSSSDLTSIYEKDAYLWPELSHRSKVMRTQLQLDHCHHHNIVRGWLCPSHNGLMHLIERGMWWLFKADKYMNLAFNHYYRCPECVTALPPLPVVCLQCGGGSDTRHPHCRDHECRRCLSRIGRLSELEKLTKAQLAKLLTAKAPRETHKEDLVYAVLDQELPRE